MDFRLCLADEERFSELKPYLVLATKQPNVIKGRKTFQQTHGIKFPSSSTLLKMVSIYLD